MSAPRQNIPDAVREAQTRASNPLASAFVAANAGSGKTYVLVSRVIRLLLAGVSPEKILCITFTKAAAANMAQRVFETLGHWVRMSDEDLDVAILAVGATKPDTRTRARARTLFAYALETPGGLKVQTIHALCTRLLQQFPFEANVPAHFAVLDERDQNDMMERANLAVLLEAARRPDGPEGRALDVAMASAADVTFKDVVREACLSRDRFLTASDAPGGIEMAMARISRALGIGDERVEDIEREIVDGPHLPRSEWLAAAAAFEQGSKTDNDQAAILRKAAAESAAEQAETYLCLFFTSDGSGTPRKSMMTKALEKTQGTLANRLQQEQDRALALREKRRAALQRDKTRALLVIASTVAANYRQQKHARGVLDYDDLIDKTHDMLTKTSSGWVHFKLDRGIDHVLVDEAQDTSPRQWDIIEHLISEFTSGAGALDGVKRTIFAVGDEKQSIFSFQGADPREFDSRRRGNETRHKNAKMEFESIAFKHSFRSGLTILNAVDYVFRDPNIYKSIHIDNAYPVHDALADAAPATLDLWNLEKPDETPDIEGWDRPFDAVSSTSPEVRLAHRVQNEIKSLIANGTMTGVARRRRKLSFGDVLVLVRRRGAAFDAVIQALKHAGIPVAGADRLKLTDHVAVIDLMNLADALLLPDDDLALAVALKSPLFGLDDDDLLVLAPDRDGTLRDALTAHSKTNTKFRAAVACLEDCERRARGDAPFSFFAWLLGGRGNGSGGRAQFLRRLGLEANDALDEFLELALSYERKEPASLQGFMAWLRAADTEVKRDMEINRDEVRVMTVHGAKGLEASVVFLIDTTTSPSDTQRLHLIRLPHGNAAPSDNVVLWAGKKADDIQPVSAAREAMKQETEDEYRRLLYVAMTRAAERLIIGGCQPGNRKEVRELSWYDLIEKGLANSDLQLRELETPLGQIKRYTRAGDIELTSTDTPASAAPSSTVLPEWLDQPAPPEPSSPMILRPSDEIDDLSIDFAGEAASSRARARLRGTLIHRLLQFLPEVAPDQRAPAATKFLMRSASELTSEEHEALIQQVLALIATPHFAPLFAQGSRAEVSIAGHVETRKGKALVSGQIDRLVIVPEEVLIVDYKTTHNPPMLASGVPRTYLRQLALYRDVLARLYPPRPVRCALLWTETAALMEISSATLDAELARIVAGED